MPFPSVYSRLLSRVSALVLAGSLGGVCAAERAVWVDSGVTWLLAAQHPDGGWGAGSHAAQEIRDPHQVATDPATTSFVAMALIRLGNTPTTGAQAQALARAVAYLCAAVESAPAEGATITSQQGTQIQRKLGPLIDTAMTTQALARVLPLCTGELHTRVDSAVDRCVAKLESSQDAAGHWGGGGWAPVLQAAAACNALETARASGKTVDGKRLELAREYQQENGRAPAASEASTVAAASAMSAGVELYAFSGSQRANAGEARAAQDAIDRGIENGLLDKDAVVNEANLRTVLTDTPQQAAKLSASWSQNESQKARVLTDDQLLSGFGNNGGEEYFSYLMTSEALLIDGGQEYQVWQHKMATQLAQAQNPDGSWSGHHCITSPAFCTAAVIQVMTVSADADYLRGLAALEVPVQAP